MMQQGYIGDPRLDELARISLGLMKEIWLLRDRQLVLERVLAKSGVIERPTVDDEPDAQGAAELKLEVDRMVARVFEGVFAAGMHDLDALRARAAAELAAEKAIRGG
jgi:hypothetical protein